MPSTAPDKVNKAEVWNFVSSQNPDIVNNTIAVPIFQAEGGFLGMIKMEQTKN